jgi:nucleoside-diphosphate-sugar epimerase
MALLERRLSRRIVAVKPRHSAEDLRIPCPSESARHSHQRSRRVEAALTSSAAPARAMDMRSAHPSHDPIVRDDRVLLAGGAGFVGATLARELALRGAKVHLLVAPATSTWRVDGMEPVPTVHRSDVTDGAALRAVLEAVAPRFVVNLVRFANRTTRADRARMVEVNVLGTERLLAAASAAGCERFLQLGSSTEYGVSPTPHEEDGPLAPTSLYGATKAAGSLLCLAIARSGTLPAAVLRPFAVYGPWDRPERLVPRGIRAALDGSTLPLTVPGLSRDWIFVEDVAEACVLALDGRADREVVNLGSGTRASNEEIVREIEIATGRRVDARPGSIEPREWDTGTWVASTAKAKRLLGWGARTPLAEGLSRTVAWSLAGGGGEAAAAAEALAT